MFSAHITSFRLSQTNLPIWTGNKLSSVLLPKDAHHYWSYTAESHVRPVRSLEVHSNCSFELACKWMVTYFVNKCYALSTVTNDLEFRFQQNRLKLLAYSCRRSDDLTRGTNHDHRLPFPHFVLPFSLTSLHFWLLPSVQPGYEGRAVTPHLYPSAVRGGALITSTLWGILAVEIYLASTLMYH